MRVVLTLLCLGGIARAETQEEAITTYCTQRAQARPPAERVVPIEGCKGLIRGAYEAMAKQKIAEAMDLLRAVDELMTPRAAATPLVETHRSDKGVRREPVRPQRRKPEDDPGGKKRQARDLTDPFPTPQ